MSSYKRQDFDAFITPINEDDLLTISPHSYSVYPDSSIRKYRARYYGVRSSEKINLLQQEILTDFSFCYNNIQEASLKIDTMLEAFNYYNIPRF